MLLCYCLVLGLIPAITPLAQASTGGHSQSGAVAWARSKIGTSDDYPGSGYGPQCVDLICFYYEYLGQTHMLGDASTYAYIFLPSGWNRYTNAQTSPQPGDIVVFAAYAYYAGGSGHVGIVTDVNSGKYTYVDYNNCGHNRPGYGCPGVNGCSGGHGAYRGNRKLNEFSCVIRPDWSPSQPTVTFSAWNRDGSTYIRETDASIGQMIKATGGQCTSTGMYPYDANGKHLAEGRNNFYDPSGISYFKINEECGYTLTPGTTYQYKFYADVGGKRYWSDMGSFATTGAAKPAAPTNVLEKINDDGIIAVTWGKVPDAARYLVILKDKHSGENLIDIYVNGTSYTHGESLPSGNYKLTVQSVSSANVLSDTSIPWNISLWYDYTVLLSAGEGGIVYGGGIYKEGDSVTLRATAASGYRFVEWRLNGRRASSSASYTFTASEDQAYTAVFERQKQTDTIHGRVIIDAVFTPYSPAGETVTLRVAPDAGYQLNSIRVVGPSGQTVALSGGGNTYTFPMPSFDVSVYVDYVKI